MGGAEMGLGSLCLLLVLLVGAGGARAGQVELVAKGAFQIVAKNRTGAPADGHGEAVLQQLDNAARLDLGEGNDPPQTVARTETTAVPAAAVAQASPGLLTVKEATSASRSVRALRVKSLRIGAKGRKPVLSATKMKTHCEIGGKLIFNFKPRVNPALNPSKSKQLGLIKGLEYLFSANRTSICVFTANCTSVVRLAQFSQSGVNDKKITAAFLKTQPKAAKKEQLAAVARVKALIEHGVRKVGKMAILTLFS